MEMLKIRLIISKFLEVLIGSLFHSKWRGLYLRESHS